MIQDEVLSVPDFAARASDNYSRFISQLQELLARIYRGEVAPSDLQKQLPGFLQERGSAYNLELSQINFQLSRSLEDLRARYSDDFFSGLLPDSSRYRAQPSSDQPRGAEDWAGPTQASGWQVVEQNSRALANYQHILQKITNGELSIAVVEKYSRDFSERRSEELVRDLAELNSRFVDGLLRLNQRVIDDLFRYLNPERNGSGRESPVETLEMKLTGPSHSTAIATMTVENMQSELSDVSCSVSEFRPSDGSGPAFRAPVEIIPSDIRLLPGEVRTVAVRLVLDPHLFIIGRNYLATMIVRRQAAQDILVFVAVRATGP
jgi:hypothetical protein